METEKIISTNLVKDGIFPIVVDINNDPIAQKDSTGYNQVGTLQGEGKRVGVPSLFIRTSGCNLRCVWKSGNIVNRCDTEYSSFTPDINHVCNEDIVKIVNNNISGRLKNIVITGGEPLVQKNSIEDLIERLYKEHQYDITIETNATIYSNIVGEYVNLISMSPKLSSSEPTKEKLNVNFSEDKLKLHRDKRKNLDVIQQYIDSCYYSDYTEKIGDKDFQLKFVVANRDDFDEIETEFLQHLKGVQPTDVYLMPQGITSEEVYENANWLIPLCIKSGYVFADRLHIHLFGKKRNV
jgi:7-carboxy-7-deazaguanine synthase